MIFRKLLTLLSFNLCFLVSDLMSQGFSEADSLRGAMRKERYYDVRHYLLKINLDINKKFISGSNEMTIVGLDELSEIQIDLFENMRIKQITRNNNKLKFIRKHNAVFVECPLKNGERTKLMVEFEGKPQEAKNAPWDGGFVWKKDSKGMDWIGVACEGVGASLWWPNKDHLSDEPDEGMELQISVPKHLKAIANGKLIEEKKDGKNVSFHWRVSYPINNYNVTLYVGDYLSYQEQHVFADGEKLLLNFHILRGNESKAKSHFSQVPKVLDAFAHYFGNYPYVKDGYALVEAPYAGMEHQSAIAYGNGYQNGYMGRKVPSDFNYDYIILHETGHEWFGNSVSCKDHAEMWIHEGFTTYMENLFVEYYHGKEARMKYLDEQKKLIQNDKPLVGPKEVNYQELSGDIYYKGAWVLQTLRYAIGNDTLWFEILRDFYQKHKYGFTDTREFIQFVNEKSKRDFTVLFRQYLIHRKIPKLVYQVNYRDNFTLIKYKWECDEPEFNLPVEFNLDGRKIRLQPAMEWKNIEFSKPFKQVEPNSREALFDVEKLGG